jgi:hypothetical protein
MLVARDAVDSTRLPVDKFCREYTTTIYQVLGYSDRSYFFSMAYLLSVASPRVEKLFWSQSNPSNRLTVVGISTTIEVGRDQSKSTASLTLTQSSHCNFPTPQWLHDSDVEGQIHGALKQSPEVERRSRVTGHSFRIGGATVFLEHGVESDIVKRLGRWRSDAALLYWRNLPKVLGQRAICITT